MDVFPSIGWFEYTINSSPQTPSALPCASGVRLSSQTSEGSSPILNDMDQAIINGEIMDSDLAPYPATTLWHAEKNVFDKLKMSPELMLSGSAEEYFYNQRFYSGIGKISDIESRYNEEMAFMPQELTDLIDMKEQQDSIRKDLVAFYSTKTLQDSLLSEFLAPVDSVVYQLDSIISQKHQTLISRRLANLTEIINTIDTISDEGLDIIKNAKSVYKYSAILLAHEWSDDSLPPNIKSDIEYIASQCPMEGGYPVYRARALKSLWSKDVYVDDSICASQPSYKTYRTPTPYNSPAPKKSEVRVYPNPNQGALYVRYVYDAITPCELTITDMEGRLVRDENITFIQSTLKFNISELPYGLYCVRLQKNGETVCSEKNNLVK